MSNGPALRTRRSLTYLQDQYEAGDKKPLEDLMRAWKGIKELSPEDKKSFFKLGGYHGEPFRGAGWSSGAYWGGYCHHGNVLFPVWHRIYVLELENALRTITGCADVTLPFWDECSDASRKAGIPWALTAATFELDGQTIPNPLKSYKLQRAIADNVANDVADYSKPLGYETVRYPYSGLVGPDDAKKTAEHNKQWTYPQAVKVLNDNVVRWLGTQVIIHGKPHPTGVYQGFLDCLDAPNYTLFSNTSSAAEWNTNAVDQMKVVPLESPHNHVHLAVGGFDVPPIPDIPTPPDFSPIEYANGDMGENDTAALDPIFFFHHCFIDYVFAVWQDRHPGTTEDLEVIEGYPGTNSVDSQGATPGVPPNSWLSMDSPLDPFTVGEDGHVRPYIGRDAFDIQKLGYEYKDGSLDHLRTPAPIRAEVEAAAAGPKVHVTGIDRGRIRGSFVIDAYVDVDGERKLIGSESVLSRWHVAGCANCQTHLRAAASFPLHGLAPDELSDDGVHVEVRTRDGLLGGRSHGLRALLSSDEPPPFRVEVRGHKRPVEPR